MICYVQKNTNKLEEVCYFFSASWEKLCFALHWPVIERNCMGYEHENFKNESTITIICKIYKFYENNSIILRATLVVRQAWAELDQAQPRLGLI